MVSFTIYDNSNNNFDDIYFKNTRTRRKAPLNIDLYLNDPTLIRVNFKTFKKKKLFYGRLF